MHSDLHGSSLGKQAMRNATLIAAKPVKSGPIHQAPTQRGSSGSIEILHQQPFHKNTMLTVTDVCLLFWSLDDVNVNIEKQSAQNVAQCGTESCEALHNSWTKTEKSLMFHSLMYIKFCLMLMYRCRLAYSACVFGHPCTGLRGCELPLLQRHANTAPRSRTSNTTDHRR